MADDDDRNGARKSARPTVTAAAGTSSARRQVRSTLVRRAGPGTKQQPKRLRKSRRRPAASRRGHSTEPHKMAQREKPNGDQSGSDVGIRAQGDCASATDEKNAVSPPCSHQKQAQKYIAGDGCTEK